MGSDPDSARSAVCLAASGANPRANHTMRTMPPSVSAACCHAHDEGMCSYQHSRFDGRSWVAVSSAVRTRFVLGAWADALHMISQRTPDVGHDVLRRLSLEEPIGGCLASCAMHHQSWTARAFGDHHGPNCTRASAFRRQRFARWSHTCSASSSCVVFTFLFPGPCTVAGVASHSILVATTVQLVLGLECWGGEAALSIVLQPASAGKQVAGCQPTWWCAIWIWCSSPVTPGDLKWWQTDFPSSEALNLPLTPLWSAPCTRGEPTEES